MGIAGEVHRLAGFIASAAMRFTRSPFDPPDRTICLPARTALQWRMPELTRRRSPDVPEECAHKIGRAIRRAGRPDFLRQLFELAEAVNHEGHFLAGFDRLVSRDFA